MMKILLTLFLFIPGLVYADWTEEGGGTAVTSQTQFLNSLSLNQNLTVNGNALLISSVTARDYLTVVGSFTISNTGYTPFIIGGGTLAVRGGQVGIGLSNPAYLLDLANGGININRNTDEPFIRWTYDTSGVAQIRGIQTGGIKISSTNGTVEWARFDSIGRFGIGGTPTHLLDISSDTLRIRNSFAIANSSTSGTQGTYYSTGCFGWGESVGTYYLYVCTGNAAGVSYWGRVALAGNFSDGAACPYVYINDKFQGTILYNCDRINAESVLKLKNIGRDIVIREVEPERSFFEWIKIEKHLTVGNSVKIKTIKTINPGRNKLIKIDPKDYITITVPKIELEFNEELYLRAKGWYERLD